MTDKTQDYAAITGSGPWLVVNLKTRRHAYCAHPFTAKQRILSGSAIVIPLRPLIEEALRTGAEKVK